MVGHGAKFSRKKEEAIAAFLTQRNIEEAAKTAGIGTQTLLRWQKIPEFDKAYREAGRAAFSQSTARLQQATSAAVTTLLKVMVDPNSSPSTKVRAADSVLNHARQAIEMEDIDVRVAALEQAAELMKQGGCS
ncbi:MAG: phage protein [Bryobacterales bacterium]|nr:phage protein [Bryobacterales bacterium]